MNRDGISILRQRQRDDLLNGRGCPGAVLQDDGSILLPPPLIALHTERPETDAYYQNGMIHRPTLPPYTWTNETDEAIAVCWLSHWSAESCDARQRVGWLWSTEPGGSITIVWTGGGDPSVEPVPRPVFSRRGDPR